MMFHSLRFKMTVAFVVTVILGFALCILINVFFLQDYYEYTKLKTLDSAYSRVKLVLKAASQTAGGGAQWTSTSLAASNGGIPDDALTDIVGIADESNLLFYVYDGDSKKLYSPYQDQEAARNILFLMEAYQYDYGILGDQAQLIKVNSDYAVYKYIPTQMRPNIVRPLGTSYIDLFGQTEDGSVLILLRASYQSIRDNANVATTFLLFSGLLACVVGAAVIFLLSKRFSKPILDMAVAAKRMETLDFGAKYPISSKDEIGKLGHSLNTLAYRLEKTITQLKSANNELQKDIAKKEEIDRQRREFLADVTHELKTPIALISGYAEGIKEGVADDDETKDYYLSIILDEADMMNKLVMRLLSLSRIETGAEKLRVERFDITTLIVSMLDSFKILLEYRSIILEFDASEHVYAWGDAVRIEEVLRNYMSNAVHYAAGDMRIAIRLRHTGGGDDKKLRVSVFNTGEQIADDEKELIWTKFYKSDKARTREYGGTGLGLSIAAAILEAHRQEYGVINKDDGVEFWFTLDE